MRSIDWLQLALFVAALALITKPMGLYLMQVLDAKGRTWLDPILKPLERVTYRLMGVQPDQEQDWKQYAIAMLLFSLVSCLFTYVILRVQQLLPLNPQGVRPAQPGPGVQHRDQLYHQHQLAELHRRIHHVVSLADGRAGDPQLRARPPPASPSRRRWCAASPGTRPGRSATSGWISCGRPITCWCPSAWCSRSCLVSQGMIQNFKPYTKAKLTEPYTIQVPKTDDKGQPVTTNVAVMVQAPKLDEKGPAGDDQWRGGDGGCAEARRERAAGDDQHAGHGRSKSGGTGHRARADGLAGRHQDAGHQRRRLHQRQRRASVREPDSAFQLPPDALHLRHWQRADVLPRPHGEEPGPRLVGVGGDDDFVPGRRAPLLVLGSGREPDSPAAWRGRRGREHGRQGSPLRHLQFRLFATITTDASCGAVNSMHDSFTALGGFVPLFNIQLGEIIIGGVGAGLYGMLVFVVLAVFIAGLMVGRTPEYLGKKIQSYDVKMAMLALLVLAA